MLTSIWYSLNSTTRLYTWRDTKKRLCGARCIACEDEGSDYCPAFNPTVISSFLSSGLISLYILNTYRIHIAISSFFVENANTLLQGLYIFPVARINIVRHSAFMLESDTAISLAPLGSAISSVRAWSLQGCATRLKWYARSREHFGDRNKDCLCKYEQCFLCRVRNIFTCYISTTCTIPWTAQYNHIISLT